MNSNSDGIVCRFIRPRKKDWDETERRPKQRAFYDPSGLSLWHEGRLLQQRASFDDLRIGSLSGFGQAHHTIGDYFHSAQQAAQESDPAFSIDIEWRPDTVGPKWDKWRDAHLEVYVSDRVSSAYHQFRQWLALNTRRVIAPDDL